LPGADTDTQVAADLALLDTAARAAGKIALDFFGQDPQVWMKQGASPVTEADFAVNHYLHDTLRPARADYGWMSEESEDNEARLLAERLFVVDPIDGTRGFVEGSEDWTISLAVVERKADRHGRPVWRPSSAALFNPCRDEMYLAQLGGGAFLNGAKIATTRDTEIAGARVSVSMPMYRSLELEQMGAIKTRHVPSLAYRLALVASGEVSAAIARPNAHDWDLAAADLLVHEAGGLLWGENGAPISYNSPIPRHGVLFASGERLGRPLLALIR
tara:strand:+ start:12688 stop:13506 length:819 start_codon:yes stop_codon:yes gene_type:complete